MKRSLFAIIIIFIIFISGIPVGSIAKEISTNEIIRENKKQNSILSNEIDIHGNSYYIIYGKIKNPKIYEENGIKHLQFYAKSVHLFGYHINSPWSGETVPLDYKIYSEEVDLLMGEKEWNSIWKVKFRGITTNNFILAVRFTNFNIFPLYMFSLLKIIALPLSNRVRLLLLDIIDCIENIIWWIEFIIYYIKDFFNLPLRLFDSVGNELIETQNLCIKF
jgi:hypothetical protein